MTIQVKHTPRKQVIIHEISQHKSYNEMFEDISLGYPPNSIMPPFRWINGIVFTFVALQTNTEFIAKERTSGVLHWDHLTFAPMPKYEPLFVSSNNSTTYITKVDKNETFVAIGKFLKKKLKK